MAGVHLVARPTASYHTFTGQLLVATGTLTTFGHGVPALIVTAQERVSVPDSAHTLMSVVPGATW